MRKPVEKPAPVTPAAPELRLEVIGTEVIATVASDAAIVEIQWWPGTPWRAVVEASARKALRDPREFLSVGARFEPPAMAVTVRASNGGEWVCGETQAL